MMKGIDFGLTLTKPTRISILSILLVLAGRTFNTSGQTETNLHSFAGYPNDGIGPVAGLVQGSDGNFYGTTEYGGTYDYGTVFRISSSGNGTNLYSFASSPNDGALPQAGLVQGSDGNFYGTTFYGGTNGYGTVFRISPSGSYTSLYSFGSSPNDGDDPLAVLVQGSDGNFYGTTFYGGTSGNCLVGCGTVFRISPNGNYTNLYSFGSQPNDGANPWAGLVQGSDGNFYGTTYQGGTKSVGTVFRISPSGTETTLYTFAGYPTAGGLPYAGLVQGSDGNLYGTTTGGGTNGGGTVFRVSPSGNYTNLYSLGRNQNPWAGLVQGSDGNLYGTTFYGGAYSNGTMFRISLGGNYTNLYSFVGPPTDGASPYAMLVQGRDGNFYGTTMFGGTTNSIEGASVGLNYFESGFVGYGTVFKLTVPLNPPPYPINQITGINKSGTNIIFTIPSIAYETYQLQFSSSMNPTNWVNVPVSITNNIGALLTLTNFGGASQPQGFYRFDITP